MWSNEYLDYVLVPVGVGALLSYQVWILWKVYTRPMLSSHGTLAKLRKLWVEAVMNRNDLLAIQTLRNIIMSAGIFISTSIALTSAVGAIALKSISNDLPHEEVLLGSQQNVITTVKLLSILICFLFSFFCYTQSLRYASHCCYLTSLPASNHDPELVNPSCVYKVLERSHIFFALGHQGYYTALPFIFWLFGPIPMIVSSVLLATVLALMDQPAYMYHHHKNSVLW